MWDDYWQVIAMILAVAGVIANNYKLRLCFVVWMVSNSVTLLCHARYGLGWLAIRDVMFLVLAVHGWIIWSGKKNGKEN